MSLSLILASGSPRRRELLTAAGYRFTICVPDVRESLDRALTLREVALRNAVRKGLSVARAQKKHGVVLAADTLVAIGGEIIGKPADLDEAEKTLRRLSGRTHRVCSAVFLRDGRDRRTIIFHEISLVRFRLLTRNAIRRYFEKMNPLDKAGAYAAQGEGAEIIERIEGSFSNVVGLPMEKTSAALSFLGVRPSLA